MRFVPMFLVLALFFGLGQQTTQAQEGQGKYITQANEKLVRLIADANRGGYKLSNNSFSIGGGWLKQGKDNWVTLYTINLQKDKEYIFLAAGDNDARDVDLQIVDPTGKVMASDTAVSPEAAVAFRPQVAQTYVVRVRLYASRDNLPSVCLAIRLSK